MNPHEQHARSEKATKLANAIHAAGIIAEDAAQGGENFWKLAERAAEVNPASAATREETIGKLRAIEAMEAKCKA